MLRKLFKAWLIFVGVSWTVNGASRNYLNLTKRDLDKKKAEAEGNTDYKDDYVFTSVWVDTFQNFEEAFKLQEKED